MKVKRHPIGGALGGLILGVGATLLMLVYGMAPFGVATLWVPIVLLFVLSIVWSLFGPTKHKSALASYQSNNAPPAEAPPEPPAEPAAD
jgi:multisubunit Na+/H+ antiporter MnhB subunit